MNFIYFHGSFGGPNENWIPHLSLKLEELHSPLHRIHFPTDSWDEIVKAGPERKKRTKQTLKNWLETFDSFYNSYKEWDEPTSFIGHSLGPLFILHVLERYPITVDTAFFVSPFYSDIGGKWEFKMVNKTFYKSRFKFDLIKQKINQSYVVYGDNDPYVPQTHIHRFSKRLNSSNIKIRNGGHLNLDAGFNQFPLLFELCKSVL